MTTRDVQQLMWRSVGLFREAGSLALAVQQLEVAWRALPDEVPPSVDAARHASLVTVAFLMARAAARREESRGAHCRVDFPQPNDQVWRKHCGDALSMDDNATIRR